MTQRDVIRAAGAPRTGLPYAQAIRAGGLVFVAGQLPLDPATGTPIAGDVGAQTRRVLDNVRTILEAAGTTLDRAVEAQCFLADVRADFAAFNEAYREYFDDTGPARTTVGATLPREGVSVEIRIVAAMP